MEIIQYVLVQRSLITFFDMCHLSLQKLLFEFNTVKCNVMSSQEEQLFWAVLFCELYKNPIFLGVGLLCFM